MRVRVRVRVRVRGRVASGPCTHQVRGVGADTALVEEKGKASLVRSDWRVGTAPGAQKVGMETDETTRPTVTILTTDHSPLAGHRASPTRRDALRRVSHLAEAQATHGRLQLLEPPAWG